MKRTIGIIILLFYQCILFAQLEQKKYVVGNSNEESSGGNYTNISVIGEPAVGISQNGTTNNKAGYIWTRVCQVPDLGKDTVICNDGTLTLDAKTKSTTYQWNTGSTTKQIQVISSGDYAVTVSEPNGCLRSDTINIIVNPVISSTTTFVDSVSCYNGTDGEAIVISTGGSGNFSYLWDNGETNPTAINLTVGTHTVTITDHLGCMDLASVEVKQYLPIVVNTIENNQVLCHGEATGIATTHGNDGAGGFTYSWDNGVSTAQNNSLTAGLHYVTVTDANFCTKIDSIDIGEPSELLISANQEQEVLCYGDSTGFAEANPTGGIGPYTYLWDNGEMTKIAYALNAIIHTITITDANGCVAMDTVQITQRPDLTATTTINAPTCNAGSNGIATVAAIGGTAPYTYQWDNGETTAQATQLTQGVHTVTITDNYGCQKIKSIMIDSLVGYSAQVQIDTALACYGMTNGASTVNATGGNAPYTYQWSDNNSTITPQVTDLGGGTYYVTVTDTAGCYAIASINIFEPTLFAAQLDLTQPILCHGDNNGIINITTNGGGTPPYSYVWSDNSTQQNRTNLVPGLYEVTMTDANGCLDEDSVLIIEPPLLVGTIANTQDTCDWAVGTITTTIQGGIPPYTYAWNQSISSEDDLFVTELLSGDYIVTITDQNLCTEVLSTTIPYYCDSCLLFPSLAVTAPTISCEPEQLAFLEFSLSGGTPAYYGLSVPYIIGLETSFIRETYYHPDSTFNFPIYSGDSYAITITDHFGCDTTTLSGIFNESPTTCENFCDLYPLEIITSPDTILLLGDDLSLRVSAADNIFWLGSTPLSCIDCPNPITTPREAGSFNYIVAATDTNGCIAVDTINVLVFSKPIADLIIQKPKVLTPNKDGFNDALIFGRLEYFKENHLTIINRWGTKVFEATNYNNDWEATHGGELLPQGTYFYQLTTDKFSDQILTGYFTIIH